MKKRRFLDKKAAQQLTADNSNPPVSHSNLVSPCLHSNSITFDPNALTSVNHAPSQPIDPITTLPLHTRSRSAMPHLPPRPHASVDTTKGHSAVTVGTNVSASELSNVGPLSLNTKKPDCFPITDDTLEISDLPLDIVFDWFTTDETHSYMSSSIQIVAYPRPLSPVDFSPILDTFWPTPLVSLWSPFKT